MRNLKRALSLTLASVMLLGMMVVGSSALSFNDADDITNVTAASVLEDLGIMQGDGSGNFMPDRPVTRAQMAIIICRILYGNKLNVSQFEGTTQYTDVAATEYYTGYINLATQLGIIGGYGDGRFGPNDTVTTAQAALMLSRALGYFKGNEIAQASDWALAAVAQATKINMFGNLNLATNAELARDNVAEMVFNTITKAVPVQYNELLGVYYNENKGIVYALTFYYTDTLGYKNFDLVYRSNVTTDYGRPGITWGTGSYKLTGNTGEGNTGSDQYGLNEDGSLKPEQVKMLAQDEIITVAYTPDYVYTANTKQDKVYKDLGKNVCDLNGDYDWVYYVDGDEKTASGEIKRPGNVDETWAVGGKAWKEGDGLAKRFSGEGAVTEVYVDSVNEEVRVVTIWNYMAEVIREREDKDGRYIDVRVNTDKCVYDLDTKYYTANYAEDDYIIVNIDNHERETSDNDDEYFIQDTYETKTVEGDVKQVRKWTDNDGANNGDYVVLDDQSKNTYSWTTWSDLEDLNTHHPDLDTAYRLYLDPNGFVVGFIATEDISRNYLYVTDAHKSVDMRARVVFADGTAATINVDSKFTNHKTGALTTNVTGGKDKIQQNMLAVNPEDIATTDPLYKYVSTPGQLHSITSATGEAKDADFTINQRVFRWSKNSDGSYTLTQLGDDRAALDVEIDAQFPVEDNKGALDKTKTIVNDAAYITANGKDYIVDKKTAFVDVEDETLYTGYDQVPNFEDASFYVVDVKSNGVADVVFIIDGIHYQDNKTWFYTSDYNDFVSENKDKTVAIQRSVWVDGEKSEDGIRINYEVRKGAVTKDGLYRINKVDKDGVATEVEYFDVMKAFETRSVGTGSFYSTQKNWRENTDPKPNPADDTKGSQWRVDDETVFVTISEDGDTVGQIVGTRGLRGLIEDPNGSKIKAGDKMTYVFVAKTGDDNKLAELVYIFQATKGMSNTQAQFNKWLGDGLKANNSSFYVGDKAYKTMKEALEAAKPGDEVSFQLIAEDGYELPTKFNFNGTKYDVDKDGNVTIKMPKSGEIKDPVGAPNDIPKTFDLAVPTPYGAGIKTITVKKGTDTVTPGTGKVATGDALTVEVEILGENWINPVINVTNATKGADGKYVVTGAGSVTVTASATDKNAIAESDISITAEEGKKGTNNSTDAITLTVMNASGKALTPDAALDHVLAWLETEKGADPNLFEISYADDGAKILIGMKTAANRPMTYYKLGNETTAGDSIKVKVGNSEKIVASGTKVPTVLTGVGTKYTKLVLASGAAIGDVIDGATDADCTKVGNDVYIVGNLDKAVKAGFATDGVSYVKVTVAGDTPIVSFADVSKDYTVPAQGSYTGDGFSYGGEFVAYGGTIAKEKLIGDITLTPGYTQIPVKKGTETVASIAYNGTAETVTIPSTLKTTYKGTGVVVKTTAAPTPAYVAYGGTITKAQATAAGLEIQVGYLKVTIDGAAAQNKSVYEDLAMAKPAGANAKSSGFKWSDTETTDGYIAYTGKFTAAELQAMAGDLTLTKDHVSLSYTGKDGAVVKAQDIAAAVTMPAKSALPADVTGTGVEYTMKKAENPDVKGYDTYGGNTAIGAGSVTGNITVVPGYVSVTGLKTASTEPKYTKAGEAYTIPAKTNFDTETGTGVKWTVERGDNDGEGYADYEDGSILAADVNGDITLESSYIGVEPPTLATDVASKWTLTSSSKFVKYNTAGESIEIVLTWKDSENKPSSVTAASTYYQSTALGATGNTEAVTSATFAAGAASEDAKVTIVIDAASKELTAKIDITITAIPTT